MSLILSGIGTVLPEHRITQADAAAKAEELCGMPEAQRRLIPALYRRAGVSTRHSVLLTSSTSAVPSKQDFYLPSQGPDDRGPTTSERMARYEMHAGPLAVKAAEGALHASETESSKITHLVTISCSGFSAPGFDVDLVRNLPLPERIARTNVGYMGCHGALNGLRVARAFADSEPDARVLICAVELCTLHHQYGWNPEQIVANALFADGAAAIVARRSSGEQTDGASLKLIANGSLIVPGTEEIMSWKIRDHGFEMTLSTSLPELIRSKLRPWLEAWLLKNGLPLAGVGSWAIHPGGPRVLQACGDTLDLTAEQIEPSRQVLEDFGNMSSPTLLFILQRLQLSGARRPYVLLGFGPGLTIEAAIVS